MQTPTWSEVIDAAIAARVSGLHVALPARVESYDAARQCVVAQPLIKRGFTDEEGARVPEALPAINDVPVVFPGSGAYSITFPIAAGDTVLLVFSSRSLDRWLVVGTEVDSEDDRTHNVSDAIAIPGLRPFSSPITPPTSSSSLVITGDTIRLGSSTANDPVALKSDLTTLKSAISGAAVAAGDGGASFKAAVMAALASWPVSSGKVKAE